MWKKLSTDILLEHPRLTLFEDQVELPGGQVVPYLRFDGHNKSVTIICVQADKVLLQEQYSYPPNEILKEFPGGGVHKNEQPREAAKRELVEECGLLAHELTELGWYYTNNRRSAEKMYVYLATQVSQCQKEGGDIEENTHQEWLTLDDFGSLITKGEITNFSVLAAWALWQSMKSGSSHL